MSVFHTKTTQSIIEPLSQQIAHLVEIHAAGEDGNPIEPLDHLIDGVYAAVSQLMIVGQETIDEANENILKRDMPPALNRVQNAVQLLKTCGTNIRNDPLSIEGREQLIEGSHEILLGTSAVLLAYDQYEVRRIIKICRGLIEFLDFARIVQTAEELVTFINNLSPVEERANDLICQAHQERLKMRLEDIRRYTPQLASSMKLAVSASPDQLLAKEEAIKQRDSLVSKIVLALLDIIRTLQLTNVMEANLEAVDINNLKRLKDDILTKLQIAKQWLHDHAAPTKGTGELAVRGLLSDASELADKSGVTKLANALHKKVATCSKDTDGLCNLRDRGMGPSGDGIRQATTVENELDQLVLDIDEIINQAEKLQSQRDEVDKNLEMAHEWLADELAKPGPGSEAIHNIVKLSTELAKQTASEESIEEVKNLCGEIETAMQTLG